MPLRALLRYLMNNEQLIQKLAESYPIRRAAQITASLYHKGKEIGEDKLEQFKENEAVKRFQDEAQHSASKVRDRTEQSFERGTNMLQSFISNLEDEWKKGKKTLDEQDNKIEEGRKRRRRREKDED